MLDLLPAILGAVVLPIANDHVHQLPVSLPVGLLDHLVEPSDILEGNSNCIVQTGSVPSGLDGIELSQKLRAVAQLESEIGQRNLAEAVLFLETLSEVCHPTKNKLLELILKDSTFMLFYSRIRIKIQNRWRCSASFAI